MLSEVAQVRLEWHVLDRVGAAIVGPAQEAYLGIDES